MADNKHRLSLIYGAVKLLFEPVKLLFGMIGIAEVAVLHPQHQKRHASDLFFIVYFIVGRHPVPAAKRLEITLGYGVIGVVAVVPAVVIAYLGNTVRDAAIDVQAVKKVYILKQVSGICQIAGHNKSIRVILRFPYGGEYLPHSVNTVTEEIRVGMDIGNKNGLKANVFRVAFRQNGEILLIAISKK